ncbi:MAG: hypothetical protein LRZ93_04195, partial [Clostridiales bacterium]|nr:hypothetical protein [Clostridiales bacterium]
VVLTTASIFALNFTIGIVQKKQIKNYKFLNQLLIYTFIQLGLTCILLIASVIEAFISPVFMMLILRFIN